MIGHSCLPWGLDRWWWHLCHLCSGLRSCHRLGSRSGALAWGSLFRWTLGWSYPHQEGAGEEGASGLSWDGLMTGIRVPLILTLAIPHPLAEFHAGHLVGTIPSPALPWGSSQPGQETAAHRQVAIVEWQGSDA